MLHKTVFTEVNIFHSILENIYDIFHKKLLMLYLCVSNPKISLLFLVFISLLTVSSSPIMISNLLTFQYNFLMTYLFIKWNPSQSFFRFRIAGILRNDNNYHLIEIIAWREGELGDSSWIFKNNSGGCPNWKEYSTPTPNWLKKYLLPRSHPRGSFVEIYLLYRWASRTVPEGKPRLLMMTYPVPNKDFFVGGALNDRHIEKAWGEGCV